LPAKKVTFLIIPDNTSRVKQFKFSRIFVGFMVCVFLFALGGLSLILRDYFMLKNTLPSTRALEREVKDQRVQVQTFAKKLSSLTSEVMALREFEKKLRIIANVEESAGKDAVFGIGGTMPEDLDSILSLSDKHSGLIREMHTRAESLMDACVIEKQAFEELHNYLQDQKSLLASTPAIRPTTGWLSSEFGYRISPFTGLKEFHRGLDIATRKGTAVIAPADGIVSFAGKKGGLGKVLVLDHGHGVVTQYGHLKKWLLRPGTRVKRGDKIALVGDTGRSTAPHLHYEIHLNGIPVNPARYILN
jgi:murein DD-endopeptidase MepM/ murein hydrolase activator NlpD